VKNTLRLQSLSDLNELGECILTLVRQDNQQFSVTLTDRDLRFWQARIAAALMKHDEQTNAKDK